MLFKNEDKHNKKPPLSLLERDDDLSVLRAENDQRVEDVFQFIEEFFTLEDFNRQLIGFSSGAIISNIKYRVWIIRTEKYFSTFSLLSDLVSKANEKFGQEIITFTYEEDDIEDEQFAIFYIHNLHVIRPTLDEILSQKDDYIEDSRREFLCCVNERNNPYPFNFNDTQLMLIGGKNPSSTGDFLRALISGLIYCYSPEEVKFIFCDKEGFFDCFNDTPYNYFQKSIVDYSLCLEIIDYLLELQKKRQEELDKKECATVDDYNKKFGKKMPKIFFMVRDFYAVRVALGSKSMLILRKIMQLKQNALYTGISIVLCSPIENRDVFCAYLRTESECRIGYKTQSALDSYMIIASKDAHKLFTEEECIFAKKRFKFLIAPAYVQADKFWQLGCFFKDEFYKYPAVKDLKGIIKKVYEDNRNEEQKAKDENETFIKESMRILFERNRISEGVIRSCFLIDNGKARKILQQLVARNYVKKCTITDYQPNITKEEYKKIFNEED